MKTGQALRVGTMAAILAAASPALSQVYMPRVEAQLIDAELSFSHIEFELDGESSQSSSESSPITTGREFLDGTLTLGISANGTIYHPNLLVFNAGISEELRRELVNEKNVSGTQGDTESDTRTVNHVYSVGATILGKKPYAVTVTAFNSENKRSHDYFSRVRAQTRGYSILSGYQNMILPLNVSYANYEEITSDGEAKTSSSDNTLDARLSNSRSEDSYSKLSLSHNEYERVNRSGTKRSGSRLSLDFSDTEYFGPDRSKSLRTFIQYYTLEHNLSDSSKFSIQERYRTRYAPNLRGTYSYRFDRRESSGAANGSHEGRASLAHQLYGSLGTSLEAGGYLKELSGGGVSSDNLSYDMKWGESYTKRLGEWGNLKLNLSITERRSDVSSSGGRTELLDEQVTLTDGFVTFLKQLNADAQTIRITDQSGTVLYSEGFDYTVVEQGMSTEIRRQWSGSIGNGETVLVSYTAHAAGSGSYGTRSTYRSFRVDVPDSGLGLYGSFHSVDNSESTVVNLDDIEDKLLGINMSAGRLRTTLEYQHHEATYSTYEVIRASEKFAMMPFRDSSLRFNFNQAWIDQHETGERLKSYQFVSDFVTRVIPYTAARAAVGFRRETGEFTDEEQIFGSAGISFSVVQFQMNVDYEYEDLDKNGELHERHSLLIRGRRSF